VSDRDEFEDEALAPLDHLDPEVPEADALDQAREVAPSERRTKVSQAIDAPEADAIEQAIEEPDLDDDVDR
jgi:hypothetical protein